MFRKIKEEICIWIAWSLPREIIYWAGIRIFSLALSKDEVLPNDFFMPFEKVLKPWKKEE